MDKKKAEAGRKRRYLGKMEKKFRGKLLLLGCLLLAVIPSLAYADYFDRLKVETYPVLGSTDVTRGVEFKIRVVALNEFGEQITPATIDWQDAQYAPIILDSTDTGAEIYDDTIGQWVSMNTPPHETQLDGGGDRIFRAKLHEVGEDKRITARPGSGWETIHEGFLNFKVHDFVDHFVIDPVPPQTAGVAFNITITAENSNFETAETFNDNVNMDAVILLEDIYSVDITPTIIPGRSFIKGVATIPITVYGSHPVSRLVNIECRNTIAHGGIYAEGYLQLRVNPNSYAKILLLVEGEEHLPGRSDPDGKQGTPSPAWTAGVAYPVQVYLTDAWWNPIQSFDIPPATAITFTSSDGVASLPNSPIMFVNPETFDVTLYTAGSRHWISILEGGKESVSTDIRVEPNNVAYFQFDNLIPETVYTTDVINVNITAYDGNNNIATGYNGRADLTCSLGDQYIFPDRIEFIGGRSSTPARITLRGNNVTITVSDGINSVTSNSFKVVAGEFSQLLVLLEGENHTPGLEDGKSLSPIPINAGEATTVTIIACDAYWNKKAEPVQIIDISCLTGYIVPPSPLPVLIKSGIPGEADCQVVFRTAKTPSGVNEPQSITVTGGGTTGRSSLIQINPGPYAKLVLAAPGERLDPGTTFDNYGKSDSASTQTAGVLFNGLVVAATDEYWNPVNDGNPLFLYFWSADKEAQLAGEDAWMPRPMGGSVQSYSDNILTKMDPFLWVRVSDNPPPIIIRMGQTYIPVDHGPLAGFEFSTIPSPINIDDPTPKPVTITARDQYGNRVSSLDDIQISLRASNESTGEVTFSPRYAYFNNGEATFNLQVFRADTNVTLSLSYGGKSGTSNLFNVTPGAYARLILLLDPPNQIHDPGNLVTEGKKGIPAGYTVGALAVRTIVYAVDQYWNRVHPPDPEPQVELTTANYLYVDANPKTMSNGVVTFWTSFRTAGNGQVLVATDRDPVTGYNDSSTINVNPGTFTKLQIIIAPGENPDPGSGSGKTGSPLTQVTGVDFDLVVRAVDNYWNLVPTTNGEGIDLTSQTDIELDSRYPPQPFEAGISTFTIWLDGNNQNVDVTAINLTSPLINPYTVTIFVQTGYRYEVVVPGDCTASNNLSRNTFIMTVRLVDDNNDVVTDANNYFQMTPCLAVDYSPATNPDGLGRKEYSLIGGERTFQQSYDTVEEICIKVTDVFGREQYSDAIDVHETGLAYRVDVPDRAIKTGEEFEMTVSLIDTGTENVVPTKDRRVNLAPVSNADLGREGRLYVNSGVLSRGTLTITNQWYTKAEWIQIKASDADIYDPPAGNGWSDPFQILPGALERLQILAPGEIHRPGEWAYIESGKDSDGLRRQDTEMEFPVTVRAVDQYWNKVDFDGGNVYLSSQGSFSSEPQLSLSFEKGEATFQVTIHQAGSSFTLKAEAQDPPGLWPQSVTIPMEVAEYRITSAISDARTVDSFLLTIELLDSADVPKQGANNSFILTACTGDYEVASGSLAVIEGGLALDNGSAEVWVNYDTVGKIRIKVSDSFARPAAYTDPIDIRPEALTYEVVAPEEVEAGKEFPLTVKLIDTGRRNLVTPEKYKRQVKLVAYYLNETEAEGKLKIENLYLQGGEKTILQSYNLAHEIYIEASDDPVKDPPATRDRSGIIEVFGAPKTVMELEGVYNEINGALYLTGATLVKILSVSDIVAEPILYRDNGADWKTYKEPFSLSPGGHTIEYYGIDKYGHKEEINKSQTIYVSFFGGGEGVSNRPNPFKAGREETLIEYNLAQPSNVTITIYDLLGQEVWRESYPAGENGGSTANSVSWDGRNLSGKVVANGGYICRIWVDKEKKHMVRKIAVAK